MRQHEHQHKKHKKALMKAYKVEVIQSSSQKIRLTDEVAKNR